MTDYDQFKTYARELGCEFAGKIGRLPTNIDVHLEAWNLPDSGGFILATDRTTGKIGVYEFVGVNGAPLIRDIEWLKAKVERGSR